MLVCTNNSVFCNPSVNLVLITALAYKQIDYDYRAINLIKDGGEQHSDEYKSLNPAEIVPSLIIDNNTLTESVFLFFSVTYHHALLCIHTSSVSNHGIFGRNSSNASTLTC